MRSRRLRFPVIATATLIAVVWYGFRVEARLGTVEVRLTAVEGELKNVWRVLDSFKEGIFKMQGPCLP